MNINTINQNKSLRSLKSKYCMNWFFEFNIWMLVLSPIKARLKLSLSCVNYNVSLILFFQNQTNFNLCEKQ